MSVTSDTSSHGKKFRWRKSYLLLVPLLLLVGVELFVDPFPRSIWALRVLTTKYLVHVRADLTIDGEPLVMDRTIRCFNPVDFFWYPGAPPRGDVRASNGQAGDTLAAVTSKGRLFAINVPDACGALGSRLDADGQGYTWTDPATNDVTPLYLSQNEIETPVLYEIHGGRHPEQIDAYIARDLLRQGYHGVKLDELVVEKTGGRLLKDWNGYDWFGRPAWVRRQAMTTNEGRYSAVFALGVPEKYWDELARETYATNSNIPESFTDKLAASLSRLHAQTQDASYLLEDLYPNFIYDVLARWQSFDSVAMGVQRKPLARNIFGAIVKIAPDWLPAAIYPCTRLDKPRRFECHLDRAGIRTYTPYGTPRSIDTWEFLFSGFVAISPPASGYAYYLSVSPRVLYAVNETEMVLTGR